MKRVTITDAKNNLSRHLQYVRRGGRVRILDRDTPVADLVPIAPETIDEVDDEQLVASLVRRGLVRPAAEPGGITEPPCPGALEAFLADRRDGR
jgi:prevent-host-death family protein